MMNSKLTGKLLATALVASLGIVSTTAHAAVFYLRADTTTMTMPDGKVVTMWGFAEDTGFGLEDGTVTVPGPTLTVPDGDTALTIHLDNNLPEPVSLIIPGQTSADLGNPVKNSGRVRSFVKEAAPANVSAVTYSWTIKPGTYMYQSGSHPSVQVQMGLYGAMNNNFNSGFQAYNNVNTAYDVEIMLFHSEIDLALHNAVAADEFGPTKIMTSTVGYSPDYYLINGVPYSAATLPLNSDILNQPPVTVNPSDRVLLRFLNAGLKTHVPTLKGLYMDIVAEDGNLLPYPQKQYSLNLVAGRTSDAFITAPAAGNLPIYDRRLYLTNRGASKGGMLSYLNISAAPFASSDISSVDFGMVQGVGQAVTLTNSGSAGLGIQAGPNGVALSGTNAADFTITPDTCSNAAVAVSGNCGFTVSFTPATTAVGVKKATLDVSFNLADSLGNLTIPLNASVLGVGVYNTGTRQFLVDINGNGKWNGPATDILLGPFGKAGDLPITGDWNGDGTTQIGIYRPSNGVFLLDSNDNGHWDGVDTDLRYTFVHQAGDVPVTGDWNGDGSDEIGLYRPSNGVFRLDLNEDGHWDGGSTDLRYSWHIYRAGDVPISGDWNGDGVTNIGIYRPSNGVFLLDLNGNGRWDGSATDLRYAFIHQAGDVPVTGDWNVDGSDEIGLYRPSNGVFRLDLNGNGTWDQGATDLRYKYISTAGNLPVIGVW